MPCSQKCQLTHTLYCLYFLKFLKRYLMCAFGSEDRLLHKYSASSSSRSAGRKPLLTRWNHLPERSKRATIRKIVRRNAQELFKSQTCSCQAHSSRERCEGYPSSPRCCKLKGHHFRNVAQKGKKRLKSRKDVSDLLGVSGNVERPVSMTMGNRNVPASMPARAKIFACMSIPMNLQV